MAIAPPPPPELRFGKMSVLEPQMDMVVDAAE
jgi:hypothetical protein